MANIIIIHDGTETGYETLSEALQHLEDGCKIVLNVDADLDQTIFIDGIEITIDLNGHDINPTHSSDTVSVLGSGHFILEDTSAGSFGTFNSLNTCVDLGNGNRYRDPNRFTMNSGNIVAQEFGVAIFGGGIVNIHGGSITGKDNAAVGANGSKKYAEYPYEINITGGTLVGETQSSGYANCGLYASNAGTVNISGGFINGSAGAGIVVRGGDVNVTGGTIQGSGDSEGKKMGDANPTFCGGIEICNAANYPGKIGTCNISGGTIVSKYNSAALVIGDPHNPDYANSENSKVIISGGEFNGVNAIGFITKQGEPIEEAQNSNLTVYGGTFNSDVSSFLDESLHLEKIVKDDGTIVYQVAKTISDVVNSIESVEDQLVDIHDIEVQQIDSLNAIFENQADLKEAIDGLESPLDVIVSNTSQSLTNESDIKLDLENINTNLSDINQRVAVANTSILEISSTANNIKSDTTAIKGTTNVISTTVDDVSSSLENLIKVDKKILEEVAKINGDDPSDVDPETPKDQKSIELLQIKAHVNDCKLANQKAFYWNHAMSETVKEYCNSKNYSVTQPEWLGGQYLIIISE